MNNLPVSRFVVDNFRSISLEGCALVGSQHLLPSTKRMLDLLFDQGLDPRATFLMGKCYSSDLVTIDELKSAGVYVSPLSEIFEGKEDYDLTFRRGIRQFASIALERISPDCRVIILDDGGELITSILQSSRLTSSRRVLVEQTTSGFWKLQSASLSNPIVNVARIGLKLSLESYLVASCAVNAFLKSLGSIELHGLQSLVIGANGAIGSAIASLMHDYGPVFLSDLTHFTKRSLATSRIPAGVNAIFGCTGGQSVTAVSLAREGFAGVLASVSSSDREFAGSAFRKYTRRKNPWHSSWKCRDTVLLNGGFPINFSPDAVATDPPEFDLTRALLLAGIYRGMTSERKCGFVTIDSHLESAIERQFIQHYPNAFRAIQRKQGDAEAMRENAKWIGLREELPAASQ